MSNLDDIIDGEEERNVAIAEINEEGIENTKLFDLNKVFEMKLSYNFEMLKDLIESLINNQSKFQAELNEKNNKISDLEKQLLDFQIMLTGALGDKESLQKLENEKSKIKSQLSSTSANKTSASKAQKRGIRPPPNDVKLETSISNEDVINKIIVSKKKFYIYINFLYLKKYNII